ncbi:MAG: TerC family protein [Oligoflexia bacterium]|nr:TerC family protein [Oligoflexia bacterium]
MSLYNYLSWILFHVLVILLLVCDLFLFCKKNQAISLRKSLKLSAFYIAMALIFNIGVYFYKGAAAATDFFTGYLIEISLSVDNLFVFLLIFTVFKVPNKYQHRVLLWGIIGAVLMRAVFILAGVALVHKFEWIMYVFGAFLVITGIKLFFQQKEEGSECENDIKNNIAVRWAKKLLPFTDQFHEEKFLVKVDKKYLFTPLFLVLIVIDVFDIVFAVDSVPAILAITTDSFIVYTSNIFAILGLRSMYFALAGIMPLFKYLQYGLAIVLLFIGVKLLLVHTYKIPTSISLLVLTMSIGGSILASLRVAKKVN